MSNPNVHARLSPDDAAALDQAVLSGFIGSPSTTPRAGRILRLLHLIDLDLPQSDSPSLLVDLVIARTTHRPSRQTVARICGSAGEGQTSLTPTDKQALDTLIDAGWRAQADDPDRVRTAVSLCALLDRDEDEHDAISRDSLVAGTLDRIQRQIQESTDRLRLDAPATSRQLRPIGMRLADLLSVAAVLLIATAVLWPMLVGLRQQARIASGQGNLNRSAIGFTLYAADHQDRLPQAQASILGGTWWDVGKPNRSHSADLFTLIRKSYASLHDLSSPGNPQATTRLTDPSARDWRDPAEVSLSYQLFSTPPLWGQSPRMVVLADRSPVVERSRRGERSAPSRTSLNYPGWGQNVLFSDGRVGFYTTPILEWGDHLWIPSSLESQTGAVTLKGNERPASPDDAFVGP